MNAGDLWQAVEARVSRRELWGRRELVTRYPCHTFPPFGGTRFFTPATRVSLPYAADVTFAYDAAGRRDTMVDGQGPTYWGYDLAGQVIALDTPQGDLTYTYNADGTRDTMTEVGLGTMSYAWDPTTGQLNSITNRFSETTSYSYHPTLGTLDTKILDSGQFEEYRYDSRYRLDRVRIYDNTITLLHETEYEFNDASEVESSVIDTVQTDYTYDGASQILTEVRSGYNCTYTYDDNGNRLSKTIAGGIAETYNYNSAELLTSVTWNGGSNYKNYTYDSAGRTIQENNTGTSRYFAYDEESRLTAISGAYSATYDYNGLDTRVEKTEASVTRNFMRDGVDVTSPVLNDGAAAYTPGISERRSSTTTYMHSGLKNADYQTDTSQLLVADRTYDAFGNLTGGSGTWQGPFGYAGQLGYQEDGSGLKLLGHRYYDPTIGRFLTRDPAKDGTNWYAYCENNPLDSSDPSGLRQETLEEVLKRLAGQRKITPDQRKRILGDDGLKRRLGEEVHKRKRKKKLGGKDNLPDEDWKNAIDKIAPDASEWSSDDVLHGRRPPVIWNAPTRLPGRDPRFIPSDPLADFPLWAPGANTRDPFDIDNWPVIIILIPLGPEAGAAGGVAAGGKILWPLGRRLVLGF